VTEATLSRYAVLFVDDEPQARKYFRLSLQGEYEVLLAESVDTGIELLNERADDIGVIITDQRMPERHGVELLRYARERHPRIIRLLTTAYSDLEDAIDAVNKGEILRYIAKPWQLPQLQLELRQAMDYHRMARERDSLIAEKMAVRQTEQRVQFMRDLVLAVHAESTSRFRFHALECLLQDAIQSPHGLNLPVPEDDIEWQWATDSLRSMMTLVESLSGWREIPEGFEEAVSAQDWPGRWPAFSAAIEVLPDVATVPACATVMDRIGTALAQVSSGAEQPAAVTISPAPTGGVQLLIERLEMPDMNHLPDLLGIYLGVFHHGGEVIWDAGAQTLTATFPANPAAITDSVSASAERIDWLPELMAELPLLAAGEL